MGLSVQPTHETRIIDSICAGISIAGVLRKRRKVSHATGHGGHGQGKRPNGPHARRSTSQRNAAHWHAGIPQREDTTVKTLLFLIPLLMTACTMTDEQGTQGGQMIAESGQVVNTPGTYRWRNWQMGGTSTWQNSMGSSMMVDNQVSFKDAAQAIVAVSASVASFKASAAAEITNRFKAGQMTLQQKNVLDNQLANVQTQADLTKFLAGLKAMETAP